MEKERKKERKQAKETNVDLNTKRKRIKNKETWEAKHMHLIFKRKVNKAPVTVRDIYRSQHCELVRGIKVCAHFSRMRTCHVL